jgi:hypothetical protein
LREREKDAAEARLAARNFATVQAALGGTDEKAVRIETPIDYRLGPEPAKILGEDVHRKWKAEQHKAKRLKKHLRGLLLSNLTPDVIAALWDSLPRWPTLRRNPFRIVSAAIVVATILAGGAWWWSYVLR